MYSSVVDVNVVFSALCIFCCTKIS